MTGLVFALVAPHVGLYRATICLPLLAFMKLGKLFIRGDKPDEPDERDAKIQLIAFIWGFGVFWVLLFGVAMFILVLHQGGTITLPIINIPLLVVGGVLFVLVIKSIAALVLYRRGVLHG